MLAKAVQGVADEVNALIAAGYVPCGSISMVAVPSPSPAPAAVAAGAPELIRMASPEPYVMAVQAMYNPECAALAETTPIDETGDA